MITGDHAIRACAIGPQLGIGNGRDAATGERIDALDGLALSKLVRGRRRDRGVVDAARPVRQPARLGCYHPDPRRAVALHLRPFLQRIFGTAPISAVDWGRAGMFGVVLFLVVGIEKSLLRRFIARSAR